MIKLKDLLFETPDRVYVDGNFDPIARFNDNDARSFMYDHVDDVLYVAVDHESWHTDMLSTLILAYDNKRDLKEEPFVIMEIISDHDFPRVTNSIYSDKGSTRRNDYVSYGYILGRYWKTKKILSFWNDSVKDVGEEKFKKFSHLFEKYSKERIEDLKVEFMDGTQTKSKKEKVDDLIKRQHLDQNAKKALRDLGLYGGTKDVDVKEPEWKKEFRENKEKFPYSVENVYVNGKRVGGVTNASSDKQAVTNIVIRNLSDSQKNYPAPHIMKAFELKGFKVKKNEKTVPTHSPEQKEFWWQK